MQISSKKINLFWLLFAVFSILSILIVFLIGLSVFTNNYRHFQKHAQELRNEYINAQKEKIKNEVDEVYNFVKYSMSTTDKRLKESIKARVYEAYAIADNLYREYHKKKSESEIQKIILDALRPIRFNNGRGYYFITRLDGVNLLFADHPEFEGKQLFDMKDTQGAYVIRDIIDIVKRDGEGYYQYTWTKPNAIGKDFPKIAYIKYFAPLNAFLGTGEYIDDVEGDIQKEVLERIRDIRFGKDGYIFVVSYDGITLMNGVQPEFIGKDMWDMTDPYGVKVIQEERRVSEKPNGDFINYHWERPTTKEISPKLSFVRGFPQWRWMIGTGVYVDEVETIIAQRQATVKREAMENLYNIGVLLVLILIGAIFISYFMSKYLQREVNVFLSFFQNLETGKTIIDIDKLKIQEFATLADLANTTVKNRIETEKALLESESRYRQFVETSEEGIMQIDENYIINFANKKMADMLGYNVDEIIRKPVDSFMHPDELDDHQKQIANRKQGKGGLYERRLLNKDGKIIWTLVSASPILDENGKFLGSFGMFSDITILKQTEFALKESEMRYRSIFDNAILGIFQTTPDGKYLSINNAYANIYGYNSPEEMMQTVSDIKNQLYVNPNVRDDIAHQLSIKGEIRNYESENIRRDGKRIWICTNVKAVKDDLGKILLYEGTIEDITEKKYAEKAFLEEKKKAQEYLDIAPVIFIALDANACVTLINKRGIELLEYPEEEILGQNWFEKCIPEHSQEKVKTTFKKIITGELEQSKYFENSIITKSGKERYIAWHNTLLKDDKGMIHGTLSSGEDITERKRLEHSFIQYQKLESIGRLAGGIAHDFNNMLAPILGYAELIRDEFPPDNPNRANTEEILKAALRAREITQQLLAFARKQTLEMKPVNLNNIIKDFEKMLHRTLRENINLKMNLASSLSLIQGDVGQIERIILNLAINAQDAMPNGGILLIETSETVLGDDYAKNHQGIVPGKYVKMTFGDTGIGIDKETLEKIFEPFFSTKEMGRGTGLGLSIVYGIVKQHKGNIHAYSEINKGTVFHIYFPIININEEPILEIKNKETKTTGSETILVVEDEQQVRTLICEILKRYGYTVLEAVDGKSALGIAKSYKQTIHLLLTDVIMPDINGKQLYEKIITIRQNIAILYMSGYPEDVISNQGILNLGVNFIQKPFSSQSLASKVRNILDNK